VTTAALRLWFVARNLDMQQKIEKWQRWINRICDQVTMLMTYRIYNARYLIIVNANPDLPPSNGFLTYFRAIYAEGAAMGIRRQAASHPDSISLRRLLDELDVKHLFPVVAVTTPCATHLILIAVANMRTSYSAVYSKTMV
jgi:hypothetical protein